MNIRSFIYKSTASILFFFCSALIADTVIMRNGAQYEGRIIAQTRTSVTLMQNGKPITLQKSNIARIAYGMTKEDLEKRRKEEEERRKKLEEERLNRENRLKRERELKEKEKRLRKELAEWNRFRGNLQDKEDSEEWVLEEQTSGKTTWGAIWRSLVFPGWGHWYLEDNIWAGVYAFSTVAILAAGANEYSIYQDKQSNYEFQSTSLFLTGTVLRDAVPIIPADPVQRLLTTTLLDDELFKPVTKQVETVNQVSIALGFIYLASLAHVIFKTQTDSSISGFAVDKDTYVSIDMNTTVRPGPMQTVAETDSVLNLQLRFMF